MNIVLTSRLQSVVAAVAPIHGVAIIDPVLRTARIDYKSSATPAQIAAGNAALAAFDWSPTADTTFAAQQATASASSSIDRGLLQSGDKHDRLVVALALVLLDEVNVIRANINAASLAPRTQAQLINAVKAKLGTLPT